MNDDWLFPTLLGRTLRAVKLDNDTWASEIKFVTDTGTVFRMDHDQDCCETVSVDEIHGDLDDLIGSPITMAEVADDYFGKPSEYAESYTWSFYKLATAKGYVTIRWLGESNGYYSERVGFKLERLSKPDYLAHSLGVLRFEGCNEDELMNVLEK